MRETGRSGIAAYLVKRIKEAGGSRRKIKFEGHNGAPDQLCHIPWHRVLKVGFFVETKKPKGSVLEAHQKREHRWLRSIGFKVFVVKTKDEIDYLIANGRLPK